MLGKGDGTFAAPVDYAVGTQPTSLMTADFNGDGKLDVAICNQADGTISVLLGNGDGTLQSQAIYAAVPGANYIAAADFNGDGKPDLAVSSAASQTIGILLNSGNGSFAKVTPFVTGSSPNALTTADFDGDGNQDVVSANADGTVSLLLGRGDGSFRSLSSVSVGNAPLSSVVSGDFNNDRKNDLAVTQSGTKLVTVLLNSGSGSFAKSATYNVGNNPAQIIVADVNGDSIPDLITANQAANTFSVLLGNGDGTFQSSVDFAVGKSPQALAAGDFDGDGRTDLAVANFADKSVSVPIGNGDGTFEAARVYGADLARKAIAVGDLDGDGKPDLVVTNFCGADAACAGNGTASVLLATSDGSYKAAGSYPLGVGPVSAALADLNDDKKLDLIAVNKGDKTVTVLLGNGDGTFQSALTYSLQNSPAALAVGDFNADGKIDLAVAGDCGSTACVRPGQLTLMLGAGDGSFSTGASYSVGYGPVSVAAGDINGDGILDLVVANACGDDSSCKAKGTATVLLGNGQGVFQPGTEISLGMSPSSLALGDLAGRKVLDLAVAYRGDNQVAILTGKGDGTFKTPVTYAAGTAPSAVVVADFNGDAKADVAVANFKDSTVSVLFGKGDGTLQTAVAYPVGAGPESLAAVQSAQSAPVDLVAVNGNSGSTPMGSDVTVLKNLTPADKPDNVTLTLTFGQSTSNYGDTLTFTTTVTGISIGGGLPMGTVEFMDNGAPFKGCESVVLQRVNDQSAKAECTSSLGNNNLLSADPNKNPHTILGHYTSTNGFQSKDSNILQQQVDQVNPVIQVTGYSVPYDAQPHTATATATCGGIDVHMDVDLSGTTHTNAMDYPSDPWTYQDPNNNCTPDHSTVHDVITKVDPVITVTPYSVTYDAKPHTAKGIATCGGIDVSGDLTLSGTTHTIVGDYPMDAWAFKDPNRNCNDKNNTVHDVISTANLTITAKNQSKIYGQTFTFNGSIGAGEFTVGGLLGSDTVTSVTLTSAGAPSTAHVAGSPYPIIASNAMGNGLSNYSITYVDGKLTVNRATPLFSALTASQSIIQGLTSITLSGTICAAGGTCPPQNDSIVVTIQGQPSQTTKPTDSKGSFSLTYPTASIAAGMYSITYSYNTGNTDTDFVSASDANTSLTVQDYAWSSTPAPPVITFVTQGFKNSDPQSYNQVPIKATATPMFGFSGDIAFECMVTPLQGQNSNPPTCAPNSGMLTSGEYSTGATFTIAAASSTPIGAYQVSIPSTTPRSDNTYLMRQTDLTVSVAALVTGLSVTSTLPATPTIPFVALKPGTSVNFSCVSITGPDGKTFAYNSPSNTYNVTCTVPVGKITLSTNPASPTLVTVTISAQAQTARLLLTPRFLATFWMGMPAVVLLGSWRFGRASRRRMWQWLGMMLIMISLLQIVACGGGFNRSALSTMPGAYTILIQGIDAGDNSLVQTTAIVQFTVLPGS